MPGWRAGDLDEWYHWFTENDFAAARAATPVECGRALCYASAGTIWRKSMDEKRKYPRVDIDEPAYVSSGGSVMSCVVRNISPEGAAIDVENPAFVPQSFRLVMAKDSSVRDCQVIWIQQKRIGVAFVAPPQEPADPGRRG
jgi:hypothetical protein